MPRTGWTPSIVPNGDDQNVYIVMDDFGRLGRSYRETDVETADLETVIVDLLGRQYNDPVRAVGFNTFEGWSQDVSADIAQELRRRCDLQLRDVPPGIQDFVDRHDRIDGSIISAVGITMAIQTENTSQVASWRQSDEPIQFIYNIVKAPLGWLIYSDGVKLGGVYASKEAAFEAATVAAVFAVRDGAGVQINVPSEGNK
jgi:hypothetical protein